MPDLTRPVRAPEGAKFWVPSTGYIYSTAELPEASTDSDYVLVVSTDGMMRGVTSTMPAPLQALLRVETDVSELVAVINELRGGS